RLAGLAPDVIRAADEGDPLAGRLVDEHARELAECVSAVVSGLGISPTDLPLPLAGGAIVNGPPYPEPFLAALSRVGHWPQERPSRVRPRGSCGASGVGRRRNRHL